MKIPKFKNESEEADWLYAHRNEIEAFKGKPIRDKNGKLMTPAEIAEEYIAKQKKTQPITIRLSAADIQRAKQRAEAKGIGYQTLIRMLLHEALEKAS